MKPKQLLLLWFHVRPLFYFSHSRFSLCRVKRSKCSPFKVIQSQLVLAVFHSDQPQQTWRLLMIDTALTDGATVICVCFGVCLMWKTSQEYDVFQWKGRGEEKRRGEMRREGMRRQQRKRREEEKRTECFFSINRLSGISSTFSSCEFRERI